MLSALSGKLQRLTWARELGLAPEDAPILAAAAGNRVDVLVTGDGTHFGHLYGVECKGGHRAPAAGRYRVGAERLGAPPQRAPVRTGPYWMP